MSKSILLFLAFISLESYATVDALTSAWIVTQNIQNEEDFDVAQVPVMGCYGTNQGPQLLQFTAEHNIKDFMGCGALSQSVININALSCAKVESHEDSTDFKSIKKITLNIAKCPYKKNSKFITMVKTAAHRNFPQFKNGNPDTSREVELVFID